MYICVANQYSLWFPTTIFQLVSNNKGYFIVSNCVSSCLSYFTGSFCPSESGLPTDCSAGTFTEIEGASMQTDCKTCPAGYYCLSGVEYPEPCLQGVCHRFLSNTCFMYHWWYGVIRRLTWLFTRIQNNFLCRYSPVTGATHVHSTHMCALPR